jgi:hypothetical protein
MVNKQVDAAFEIVLEEVENAIEALNKEGAKAFSAGNYDKARQLGEQGEKMSNFRDRIEELQQEWNTISGEGLPETKPRRRRKGKRKWKKLKPGLRTSGEAYRIPILQALLQLGDSANINDVLEIVYENMKSRLNKYDHMPLKSIPNTPRWRNAAQWTRAAMVEEGLMASDSPIGTWEITEEGREWLSEQEKGVL